MKKGILSITALAVVLLISFTSLTVKPAANATEKKPAVTVSEEKALGARFLNMLNHNFVYNDAFESVYEMTACSKVALFDKAEDGYIKQSLISPPLQRISRSAKIMFMLFRAVFRFINIRLPLLARMRTAATPL